MAVNEFKHAKLGSVRSMEEAQEDPDWQQEVQDMRAAGCRHAAAAEPQPEVAGAAGTVGMQ